MRALIFPTSAIIEVHDRTCLTCHQKHGTSDNYLTRTFIHWCAPWQYVGVTTRLSLRRCHHLHFCKNLRILKVLAILMFISIRISSGGSQLNAIKINYYIYCLNCLIILFCAGFPPLVFPPINRLIVVIPNKLRRKAIILVARARIDL